MVVDQQRLAVQYERVRGQRPDQHDELGEPAGDVVEAARPDRDVLARAVHLDADAVELAVDQTWESDGLQPGIEVGGGAGQHRLDGPADLEADHGQRCFAAAGCRTGGERRRPGQHHRAAHDRHRDLERRGDALDEHAFQSPRADLAGDQAAEQGLLGLGRRTEQRLQPAPSLALRPGARRRGDLVERRIDLCHGE